VSRLSEKFEQLNRTGRKALIPFVTAGDPEPSFTVPLMHEMVTAGADIIELGVPFSDPMADGPVIQKASERSLLHKTTVKTVLEMVAAFRKKDSTTPVVLMGYLNPIEYFGYPEFADQAGKAGVDGLLTVDMPPEEAEEFIPLLKQNGIDPIFLLAPNSTEARIKKVSAMACGYLYYVSLKGITGAGHLDLKSVEDKLAEIKKITSLPVGVGFGVKNAEIAAAMGQIADGVVVGSALVNKVAENLQQLNVAQQEIIKLLSAMREAMDKKEVTQ
jgi:tryptophan synthase alpha chain